MRINALELEILFVAYAGEMEHLVRRLNLLKNTWREGQPDLQYAEDNSPFCTYKRDAGRVICQVNYEPNMRFAVIISTWPTETLKLGRSARLLTDSWRIPHLKQLGLSLEWFEIVPIGQWLRTTGRRIMIEPQPSYLTSYFDL